MYYPWDDMGTGGSFFEVDKITGLEDRILEILSK